MTNSLPQLARLLVMSTAISVATVGVVLFSSTGAPAFQMFFNDNRSTQDGAATELLGQLSNPSLATLGESRTALSSILDSDQWLNVKPLGAADLRGKVVLVNFWTYSCINSLRPLPYIRAWAEKYRNRGLVVIGVHTPEFEFEKDVGNVRQAVEMLGIQYPIRLDSDFATWHKFGNRAWPGFYFIDANGRVRLQKFGEGDYAGAERALQKLLNERDGKSVTKETIPVAGYGVQAAPDWTSLRTSETYLGYAKAENFVSPGGIQQDTSAQYHTPSWLTLNHWSLGGKWQMSGEFAKLDGELGSISHRFHARDLHIVLGTNGVSQPVAFRVSIDGAAPGADHGADVDENGWGTVREDRLYQLVRQKAAVTDRTFKIEFLAPGVRAYAFTFG